jgi:hypothetical protein
VAAVTQRGLCLRCYSNSAASTSGSSTSETSSGQRKLKYNLRPLNKGKDAHLHAFVRLSVRSTGWPSLYWFLGLSGLFLDW